MRDSGTIRAMVRLVVTKVEDLPAWIWVGRTGPLERPRLGRTLARLNKAGLRPSWGSVAAIRARIREIVESEGSYLAFAEIVGAPSEVVRAICRGRRLPSFVRLVRWSLKLAAHSTRYRDVLLAIDQPAGARPVAAGEAVGDSTEFVGGEGSPSTIHEAATSPVEADAAPVAVEPAASAREEREEEVGTDQHVVSAHASAALADQCSVIAHPTEYQDSMSAQGGEMRADHCALNAQPRADHYAWNAQEADHCPLTAHLEADQCDASEHCPPAASASKKNDDTSLPPSIPDLDLNPAMVVVEFRDGDTSTRVGSFVTLEVAKEMIHAAMDRGAFTGTPYIDGRPYKREKSQEELIAERVAYEIKKLGLTPGGPSSASSEPTADAAADLKRELSELRQQLAEREWVGSFFGNLVREVVKHGTVIE